MAPTKETKETITSKVVDFSKVKDGGGNFNKRRVRSGDYLAKVVKVQDAKSKAGDFQYLYTIQLVKHATNKYPFYCQLTEKTLWKLRNLFIAGGLNVPKKRVKLDPTKVVGKLIGVTMDDAEYEGKPQSEVVAVFPASELPGDSGSSDSYDDGVEDQDDDDAAEDDSMDDLEDSDDTEGDSEDDDTEEDAEDEDEFASMDRTALKAYLKAQDPDFVAKKSQSDDDLRELARAAGGDEEEEETEEEPEPEPTTKAKKKKAKAKPKDDDEEFEELDLDEL
jgi:hypothetical protein